MGHDNWSNDTNKWSNDTNKWSNDTNKWSDDTNKWSDDTNKWHAHSHRQLQFRLHNRAGIHRLCPADAIGTIAVNFVA